MKEQNMGQLCADAFRSQADSKQEAISSDTIAAIATPIGYGGIGIIRISGPEAAAVLGRLFSGRKVADMESHRLYLGDVCDETGQLLDRALAVIMRAPHSYTGEDVAELQLHGGPKVLAAVLSAALASGARLATAGEFTLRAFLSGRIDLSQAEAVADLIAAKTPQASRQAAGQLQGRLGRAVGEIETDLNRIYASIIVGVDFPDDADAADPLQCSEQLRDMIADIEDRLLAGASFGRVCREGVQAALLGKVNAGKSSLLNALLSEERAIVSDLPGTTRDVLDETVDLGGMPVVLTDTAGLRADAEADAVERQGIARSRKKAEEAQLALVVLDGMAELDADDHQLLRSLQSRALVIINKCDLLSTQQIASLRSDLLDSQPGLAAHEIIAISAKTGKGLEELRAAMRRKILGGLDSEAVSPLVNNARHEQALRQAAACLRQCVDSIESGLPLDMAAVDVSEALRYLGEISGRSVSEHVLDDIFSRFCLGK